MNPHNDFYLQPEQELRFEPTLARSHSSHLDELSEIEREIEETEARYLESVSRFHRIR